MTTGVGYEDLWSDTRAGARAARGFYFQDLIGAWLAIRSVAGLLPLDAIVPESLEDLTCEGQDAWHVQVKSRQERVGDFSFSELAAHVLAVWEAHLERSAKGLSGRPVLVLERSIEGFAPYVWGEPLGVAASSLQPLLDAVQRQATRRGLDDGGMKQMLSTICVVVVGWTAALDEAQQHISTRTGLLPAGASAVIQALRARVAECVAANAAAGRADRVGISRTSIGQIVDDVSALIDRSSLEEALRNGVCEAVDLDTPHAAELFFEGVSVQPGHIAAGLPARRPHLTGQAVAGLNEYRPVLVTGPSGVGKSAVMWMTAYSARHALWYRVQRLQENDVEPLVRFVRALRPSDRTPVGLVVDGLGTGALQAWDDLVERTADIPGVYLLASVRTEDLLPLRLLSECRIVEVRLDEEVAEHIYQHLRRTGLTSSAYWREAFEAAQGLTLEFTHILTQGRRLNDLISDQVRRRVVEKREAELRIVALVSAAHTWNARLQIDPTLAELSLDSSTARIALQRLIDEHLLEARDGYISGLHPLRSAALVEAVHRAPPPTLESTVQSVIKILETSHLASFVSGVLIERPELEKVIMAALAGRLASRSPLEWTNVLHGLRLVEFHRQAQDWHAVFDRHDVRKVDRAVTIQFLIADIELLPQTKPEIAAAINEIRGSRAKASPAALRDSLIDKIGREQLWSTLTGCDSLGEASRLLATLSGTEAVTVNDPLDISETPLVTAVQGASLDDLASFLYLASTVSLDIGEAVIHAIGGRSEILDRIRRERDWILDLEIITRGEQALAYARLLHVSDAIQGNPDSYVRDLAKLLLKCFPECVQADVQALLPGSRSIEVGSYTAGVSHLQRRYLHTESAVGWNRARVHLGASLASGQATFTERVSMAFDLVASVDRHLDELTRLWCQGRRPRDPGALNNQQAVLRENVAQLIQPIDRTTATAATIDDKIATVPADPVAMLVLGIVDNLTARLANPDGYASLAAYIGDTLGRHANDVATNERWELIGLTEPPPALDELANRLHALHATLAGLVWGNLSPQDIKAEARNGPSSGALGRAADLALRSARQQQDGYEARLKQLLDQSHVDARILSRPASKPDACYWPPFELAIVFNIDSPALLDSALQTAADTLKDNPTRGARPPVLLAPSWHNRPIRRLAHVFVSSLFPLATDLFDTWIDQLGEQQPTPLADAAADCLTVLQVLSGISLLVTPDQADRYDLYINQQLELFSQSVAVLRSAPQGHAMSEILDALTHLAANIEQEFQPGHQPGAFATSIAKRHRESEDRYFDMFLGVLAIATYCDLDPSLAEQLLDAHPS